ncbi:unnamed protein product [Amoebophrya sp. A120]|nr:unnamed protein product [Amoebophrya sp. A120]|eukprot:GSA120T00014507001.1
MSESRWQILLYDIVIAGFPIFLYFGPAQLFYDIYRVRRKKSTYYESQNFCHDTNTKTCCPCLRAVRKHEDITDRHAKGAAVEARPQEVKREQEQHQQQVEPHQELQVDDIIHDAVVCNPVIDVALSSPNKSASENEAITIRISLGSGATSTNAGGAVVASTGDDNLIIEQSSSSSTTAAVLDHENHDTAGCAIGALPPRTCFVKEGEEGGTRTTRIFQNNDKEQVEKHHILRAGGSAITIAAENLTAVEISNKTPSSGDEAFHVESSDQAHFHRFSSEQDEKNVAQPQEEQDHHHHLFLETPPLQFLAQCANGWTWTLFMFLDGLRTGIIPCTVQTLAGFLWVYLYRHCYRMDLYEKQFRRQTKILLCYLLLITIIFIITAAIDYPTVLTAWVDNETNDDSSDASEEDKNQDYKSTVLILEVKLVFQLLGMTTFLVYMGSPAFYAYKAFELRKAEYMGSFAQNFFGLFVCSSWAFHLLVTVDNAEFLGAANFAAAVFSAGCLLLRLWLWWTSSKER